MATVMIVISDREDGQLNVETTFGDGFKKDSHAHQYANIMNRLGAEYLRTGGEAVQLDSPKAEKSLVLAA